MTSPVAVRAPAPVTPFPDDGQPGAGPGPWSCVDLPSLDYEEAYRLQRDLVAARQKGVVGRDVVLLLEHPPVFTLGRRGGLHNLTVSQDRLREKGVPVIQVERGGDITYHGPGQLVAYPIVHLERAGLEVADFIGLLEEVMIRVAVDGSVPAGRNPRNRGTWVGPRKLGSVGISVRKGVSFHGFALNVTTDLEPFDWIYPCGLRGVRMTSLMREARRPLTGHEVRASVKHHMERVFGIRLVATPLREIERLLKPEA